MKRKALPPVEQPRLFLPPPAAAPANQSERRLAATTVQCIVLVFYTLNWIGASFRTFCRNQVGSKLYVVCSNRLLQLCIKACLWFSIQDSAVTAPVQSPHRCWVAWMSWRVNLFSQTEHLNTVYSQIIWTPTAVTLQTLTTQTEMAQWITNMTARA